MLKPNSAMLAAICETYASECVLGFRAYGISFSSGQCSMRCAIGGVSIALLQQVIFGILQKERLGRQPSELNL